MRRAAGTLPIAVLQAFYSLFAYPTQPPASMLYLTGLITVIHTKGPFAPGGLRAPVCSRASRRRRRHAAHAGLPAQAGLAREFAPEATAAAPACPAAPAHKLGRLTDLGNLHASLPVNKPWFICRAWPTWAPAPTSATSAAAKVQVHTLFLSQMPKECHIFTEVIWACLRPNCDTLMGDAKGRVGLKPIYRWKSYRQDALL